MKHNIMAFIIAIFIAFLYLFGGYRIIVDDRYAAKSAVVGFLFPPYAVYIGFTELWGSRYSNDNHNELRGAANNGDIKAQFELGWKLQNEKNFKEASEWFKKVAAHDSNLISAKAQHNLGAMYENGQGVQRDFEQSVYWYKRGALNGDISAQSNLGTMYFEGRGVSKDYSEAIYWLEKAAEQADAEANYNLGLVHYGGFGVQKNRVLAYYFFGSKSFWKENARRR